MSFPLTEARKSGWLPPIMGIDSRSGFVAGVPYYWNIAPNRDATITPIVRTNRGPGVDGEFRYLEPGYSGTLRLDLLPYDRLSESTRYALNLAHDGLPMPEWGLQLHAHAGFGQQLLEGLSGRRAEPDAAPADHRCAAAARLLEPARRRRLDRHRRHPGLAAAAGKRCRAA